MNEFPILSLMTFLPLIGAVLLLLVRGQSEAAMFRIKMVALLVSGLTFILSVVMLVNFDPLIAEFQFIEKKIWFESVGISYHMGIDGISLFFVVLSAFLTPICILASWNSVSMRLKEYLIAFLMLETFMIGTFCALDAILFYLFFEGVLIPMFIIIGVWGGERRVYA
ncbi:MAG: NADH-quinone oxidoreductase subunit M, partial [Alphaproteobacteria bacterium]|nr:NADH-quinone oxidoreductase subunit M [Alphaproteobacteria bacterium]